VAVGIIGGKTVTDSLRPFFRAPLDALVTRRCQLNQLGSDFITKHLKGKEDLPGGSAEGHQSDVWLSRVKNSLRNN
jgi:hypothetical protein